MTTNTKSAQERTASIDLAQLDKLEALARAATPGEWKVEQLHGGGHHNIGIRVRGPLVSGYAAVLNTRWSDERQAAEQDANANFIATANPATVRQLITLARRSLTSGAPAKPVAYLHQVVSGDGEPDQALSFAPDNFPLAGTLGYRSISHVPLSFGCSTESAAIAKKAFDAAILLASDTINAKNAEIEDLRAQLSAGAAAKAEQAPEYDTQAAVDDFVAWLQGRGALGPGALSERIFIAGWCRGKRRATAAGAGSAQPRDVCAEMRALCSSCGGTGDVHSFDGEWRGECNCPAGIALALDRLKIAAAKTQRENEELRAALARAPLPAQGGDEKGGSA